ncbi:MAG: DUF1592 domain-containing protein [Gemmataceae bacterium]
MRLTTLAILFLTAHRAAAADPADRRFDETVRPFLRTYCLECHDHEKAKGDLDLSAYMSAATVAKDWRRWETVVEQLREGRMPPAKAAKQPTADARRAVVECVTAIRDREAERNAGDPGPVPARRLSNAEYDNTIRDLTGVDLRPAREFPVDPANEAGFDNSAESLSLSPPLLKKYLEAARRVSEHVVFKPDELAFAEYPVVADTDRDKYSVRRIIDFYKRQPTDLADYFLAAWRYENRAALGRWRLTLADFAAEGRVSPKYLATVHALLTQTNDDIGPVAAVQALWRDLGRPDQARAGCERLRDFVGQLRQQLKPHVNNLTAPGMNNGAQPLVLWKNRQWAANRRHFAGALQARPTGLPADSPAARALTPPKDTARYEATFAKFCDVFPDAFYVSERARSYLDPEKEKKLGGRLLSAGFHSMTGYFRDDRPLYDLILDTPAQEELDRLWLEFDVITGAPIRQHTSFIWFERTDSRFMRDAEFDAFRAEDKDATSQMKVAELREVYLAKVKRNGGSDVAVRAVEDFFAGVEASVRRVEDVRRAAEPKHVAAVQDFAERAYRRPLTAAEREDVAAFYRSLRDRDGLTHEEAIRDALVTVLVSPHFLYRVDPRPAGDGIRPLSGHALASRLSYFLWSSLPDRELLDRAVELHRPEVLTAQARRMLKDDRVRGLATEFGGNWLDFRRFEEHAAVDRGRFPEFTDELRQAMFEEPVRFLIDVARRDRSVLDLIDADDTFVNPVLAKHYGMTVPTTDGWVRVAEAKQYGRGGLPAMAVFLTKNAPGLRTSPVKRGYWVVRRLLGETIPAPPATVPELPSDEAKLGDRTLREALALHRSDKACAGCHERFDSVGLALEGFGPVGERRTKDFGGRPVDTTAAFPGGGEGTGIDGLRAYIRERRQADFLDNLCRKLLAYGLGRTLLPSDDRLVREMKAKLIADGYRFGSLIDSIVTSPQFLNARGSKP